MKDFYLQIKITPLDKMNVYVILKIFISKLLIWYLFHGGLRQYTKYGQLLHVWGGTSRRNVM